MGIFAVNFTKMDALEKPFVYGIAADVEHFTDRQEETQRLCMNFKHGVNTILISPRRWGKTSLVNKVAKEFEHEEHVRVVRMDIFSIRTREDFYRMFAMEIIKQTATRAEEWLEHVKQYLSSLVPYITLSADPMNPISLSLQSVNKDYDEEVLSLPERIAQNKGVRLVICIDEFQQIGEMVDSLTFQKKLRTAWQHQHNVTYCLYGSKRHLLISIFNKRSYPFYKFGDILFLERIPLSCWQEYIRSRFEATNRTIKDTEIEDIYRYVDGNSSYVQQLSWLIWAHTDKTVTPAIMEEAKQDLLRQNHALFMEQVNNLSAYQIHFLMALMDEKGDEINRKEVISYYNLGSSSNVAVVKKALQKKDIIEVEGKHIVFTDPMFVHWLRANRYKLF